MNLSIARSYVWVYVWWEHLKSILLSSFQYSMDERIKIWFQNLLYHETGKMRRSQGVNCYTLYGRREAHKHEWQNVGNGKFGLISHVSPPSSCGKTERWVEGGGTHFIHCFQLLPSELFYLIWCYTQLFHWLCQLVKYIRFNPLFRNLWCWCWNRQPHFCFSTWLLFVLSQRGTLEGNERKQLALSPVRILLTMCLHWVIAVHSSWQ